MHHQLPSLSSSVSSNSSLSSPSSPTGHSASEPQQQQQQRRQGLPPQRSASAGALMRQQQQQQQQNHHHHHHHHHHTAAIFRHSCHAPLRPASWIDDERRISFTQQNQGNIVHHQHTPSIATTLQLPIVQPLEPLSPASTSSSQRHTMLWDESQLAMELAEDDLMDDTHIKRRRSARRIKEKLMSTIIPQQQDLANSMPNDRDMQAVSPTTSNRIARSLKKLTGFIF